MAPELTGRQARAIIDDIRKKQGAVTPQEREQTPPSVLEAIDNLQWRLGVATRT